MVVSQYTLLVLVACAISVVSSQSVHSNCTTRVVVNPGLAGSLDCTVDLGSVEQEVDSLHCALEAISNSGYSSREEAVCIELPEGEHVLEYSTEDIGYSVTLTAAGESTVTCAEGYNSSANPAYTEFPLKFTNGTDIVFIGVSFTNCLRPLLFSEVNSVRIEDCHFR